MWKSSTILTVLTKGDKKNWKLTKIEHLTLYDKFAHFVWILALFYMINLDIMFENCIFYCYWFWGENQFSLTLILRGNQFYLGWSVFTDKRKLKIESWRKFSTRCYMINSHIVRENYPYSTWYICILCLKTVFLLILILRRKSVFTETDFEVEISFV